jgi:NADPH:quinone reductase-like Zn-dependent oxidoreductase
MKAIVQDRFGSPDVLDLREIDKPAIKDDEVLLRVRAASVNPADWAFMRGMPYIARTAFGLRKPKIRVRGIDVAGTVEAVGSKVTRLRPGDEVFGQGKGTFAEYAAAREKDLAAKPANLTFEQAAAVPMAALVALQAIRDKAKIQPGQKVLVNGAGGGIGTFTVQVAKAFGADVTGVCSPAKVDLVRSLGADHVIDYTKQDFTQTGERYDFILDNAASQSLSRLRRVLTPKGTLIVNCGQFNRHWIGPIGRMMRASLLSVFASQKLGSFLSLPNEADLTTLREIIEAGKLGPVIDRTYPLSEAPAAMAYVGEGHSSGKVVISVSGSGSRD